MFAGASFPALCFFNGWSFIQSYMSNSLLGRRSANSSDYRPVSICFADGRISELFSDLLRARGVTTSVTSNPALLPQGSKIVTEPQYFSHLAQLHPQDCLLVGPQEALRGCNAIHLCQPLTEKKIEAAIGQFLR